MTCRRLAAAAFLVPGFAACAGVGELPPGTGRGLVSFEREPPDGAVTAARPTWKVGDRFLYRRGNAVRVATTVIEAGEGGYVLEEDGTGMRVRLSPDLGDLGQEAPDHPEWRREYSPGDVRYCWPLWAGKDWLVHYLFKAPGREALPFAARYQCDAIETVQVPAGTFRCYRIWRRLRPAVDGEFLETTTVSWYAPEVGTFVRRLENGIVLELEECIRQ
jgi:hypothetical protein